MEARIAKSLGDCLQEQVEHVAPVRFDSGICVTAADVLRHPLLARWLGSGMNRRRDACYSTSAWYTDVKNFGWMSVVFGISCIMYTITMRLCGST